MALEPHLPEPGHPHDRSAADQAAATAQPRKRGKLEGLRGEASGQPRPPGLLDAGPLEPDIVCFRLHLAAEGKSARTVQGYTSAVSWFAAGYLLGQAGKTSWDQVDARDIQQWTVQLLDRYSSAYASIQFRALRQFFKWRPEEEQSPDPMARLRAPKVAVTAVPVFTSGELSELAKGRTARTVKISHQAARNLDRYLRARARHPQAWRPQLWLGVNGRGPLTATGIYQAVARRGRKPG